MTLLDPELCMVVEQLTSMQLGSHMFYTLHHIKCQVHSQVHSLCDPHCHKKCVFSSTQQPKNANTTTFQDLDNGTIITKGEKEGRKTQAIRHY